MGVQASACFDSEQSYSAGLNSNADKLSALLSGFFLHALGEMIHADDGAFVQAAGDKLAFVARGAFEETDEMGVDSIAGIPPPAKINGVLRLNFEGQFAGQSNSQTIFHFGSKSATMARSSFNSLTVASIFARLNSFTGTPWTICNPSPSLRTGNEQIKPFSMP